MRFADAVSLGGFDLFQDREWVKGEGVVVRMLDDDTEPPCHQ